MFAGFSFRLLRLYNERYARRKGGQKVVVAHEMLCVAYSLLKRNEFTVVRKPKRLECVALAGLWV